MTVLLTSAPLRPAFRRRGWAATWPRWTAIMSAGFIDRLVSERPEITGITLPGMPGNAPGMARKKTGTLKTYAFGAAGVSVYSDE